MIATLAGAVLAGLIALWLARADRADALAGDGVLRAGDELAEPAGGAAPDGSQPS